MTDAKHWHRAGLDPSWGERSASAPPKTTACIDHGQRNSHVFGYATTRRNNRKMYMHRAVFQDTYGYLPAVVRHTCDNPRCINPAHLVPGTVADNACDMVLRGRSLKGTKRPKSKLTGDDVRLIRKLKADGVSYSKIAKQFGVAIGTIQPIISGKTWGT